MNDVARASFVRRPCAFVVDPVVASSTPLLGRRAVGMRVAAIVSVRVTR